MQQTGRVREKVENPFEIAQKNSNFLVYIGFEDDPDSFKKIPRNKLSEELINRIFECNIDHLRVCFCVCV